MLVTETEKWATQIILCYFYLLSQTLAICCSYMPVIIRKYFPGPYKVLQYNHQISMSLRVFNGYWWICCFTNILISISADWPFNHNTCMSLVYVTNTVCIYSWQSVCLKHCLQVQRLKLHYSDLSEFCLMLWFHVQENKIIAAFVAHVQMAAIKQNKCNNVAVAARTKICKWRYTLRQHIRHNAETN